MDQLLKDQISDIEKRMKRNIIKRERLDLLVIKENYINDVSYLLGVVNSMDEEIGKLKDSVREMDKQVTEYRRQRDASKKTMLEERNSSREIIAKVWEIINVLDDYPQIRHSGIREIISPIFDSNPTQTNGTDSNSND